MENFLYFVLLHFYEFDTWIVYITAAQIVILPLEENILESFLSQIMPEWLHLLGMTVDLTKLCFSSLDVSHSMDYLALYILH